MPSSILPADASATERARGRVTVGFCLWLLAVTVLGGAMRLHHLGAWSFWEDELFSIRSVLDENSNQVSKRFGYVPINLGLRLSGADLDAARFEAPHEWQAVGITEWRARIGPCIVGILTIPLLALASVRVLGLRAAGIVALLLALSPWHLFWSQSSRFYTLQFLFYNLALLGYFYGTERRSERVFIPAMIAMVLAYLSQPPALLIGLVFAGDWLLGWVRRKPVYVSPIMWVAGCIAVAICLGLHFYDLQHAGDNWEKWGSLDGHSARIIVIGTVWENFLPIVLLGFASFLGLFHARQRLVTLLMLNGTLPILALIALALTGTYSHTRYGFPMHFGWLALCALGLDALYDAARPHFNAAMGYAATAALVGALLLSDYMQLTTGYGLRRRWHEGFKYILDHRKPDDIITSERTLIAQYYLQEEVIPEFPRSPEDLARFDRPTWLILPSLSATHAPLHPWLDDATQLKRYYDLRVVQPFSSVRVYYYDPALHGTPDAQ